MAGRAHSPREQAILAELQVERLRRQALRSGLPEDDGRYLSAVRRLAELENEETS